MIINFKKEAWILLSSPILLINVTRENYAREVYFVCFSSINLDDLSVTKILSFAAYVTLILTTLG